MSNFWDTYAAVVWGGITLAILFLIAYGIYDWLMTRYDQRVENQNTEVEEPFGVTEFLPIEPTIFDPEEYMEWPQCTSCGRKPNRAEEIYEVPVDTDTVVVKILCSNCGRVPA